MELTWLDIGESGVSIELEETQEVPSWWIFGGERCVGCDIYKDTSIKY
jgi:hypothetical protein